MDPGSCLIPRSHPRGPQGQETVVFGTVADATIVGGTEQRIKSLNTTLNHATIITGQMLLQ